jgi:putative transcriptional regulator
MENAIHVAVALKDAGFEVSQICCCRLSCFDFVAKKRDFTVLLKVASDIDSFPVNQLREVKVVASRIPAAALLIGQQSHGKPLDDDTVYSRNNVNIVNPKTIISVAEQTGNPLVYAGPGGYAVQLYANSSSGVEKN